jgi:hypothetical protein
MFAALAVAVAVAGCGGGSTRTVTRTVTVPRTTTPPKQSTSPTSSTGTTSSAQGALAADDAAEALARSASAGATTYGTDNNGNYTGLSAAALHSKDSTIQVGPGVGKPYIASSGGVAVLADGAGYSVTATSTSGDSFSLGESASGTATRSCTGSASTACQNGSW